MRRAGDPSLSCAYLFMARRMRRAGDPRRQSRRGATGERHTSCRRPSDSDTRHKLRASCCTAGGAAQTPVRHTTKAERVSRCPRISRVGRRMRNLAPRHAAQMPAAALALICWPERLPHLLAGAPHPPQSRGAGMRSVGASKTLRPFRRAAAHTRPVPLSGTKPPPHQSPPHQSPPHQSPTRARAAETKSAPAPPREAAPHAHACREGLRRPAPRIPGCEDPVSGHAPYVESISASTLDSQPRRHRGRRH